MAAEPTANERKTTKPTKAKKPSIKIRKKTQPRTAEEHFDTSESSNNDDDGNKH